jgi:hypothetical protein
MRFEMSPRTVVYGDHMKIRGSGTEVDCGSPQVERRRRRGLRAKGKDLRVGREVVENRKGGGVCEQRVTHEHEWCHY